MTSNIIFACLVLFFMLSSTIQIKKGRPINCDFNKLQTRVGSWIEDNSMSRFTNYIVEIQMACNAKSGLCAVMARTAITVPQS